MPVTTNFGIAYNEFHEGYRTKASMTGAEATRICDVAWSYQYLFQRAMIGVSFLNGSFISRVIPEVHPETPYLYATECEVLQGVGVPTVNSATGLIRFENKVPGAAAGPDAYARIAVHYQSLPYTVLDDAAAASAGVAIGAPPDLMRYVIREEGYNGENLAIGSNSFAFGTPGGTALNADIILEPTPVVIHGGQLRYTCVGWPTVPIANIRLCISKVNDALFDGFYAAQTLLYVGAEVRRYSSPFGGLYGQLYDIVHQFAQRGGGNTWNKLYRKTSAGFVDVCRITATGTSTCTLSTKQIYETYDFNSLFRLY